MSAPFAASLERSLQRAASIARDQSREHVTPEDLLIALIDDEDAAPLWSALLIDVDSLRRDVAAYMQGATDGDSDDPSQTSKFSPDLDRVVEIASTQVQSAGRHVVTGVDILVGLFTVLGVVARHKIMLIEHYRHLERYEGQAFGPELVLRGAKERLVPILMTALAAGLALVPLLLSGDKPGQEIEYPMAIVILGGLITSTLLNLFVVPSMYLKYGKAKGSTPAV